MLNVVIEKGAVRAHTETLSKYPWHQLEVGDSIRFKSKNTANAHAKRAAERWAPKKFEGGLDVEGVARVWRTE